VEAVVWIPEGTAEEHRALLPTGVGIRELPASGALPEHLGSADILVVGSNARAIEAASRLDGLKVVQTMSAGVDAIVGRIPVGVTLCDASGVHDVAVSEWAVMAMLAARRDLAADLDAQRSLRWRDVADDAFGDDLEGATVLIVGHGSIGRALEARLVPFGVRIQRVARHARDGVATIDDLPALLPVADVVVILLPLTPETRGVVDASFLGLMKPGAVLVNAARGALVDTDALIEALDGKRMRAVLDVTDPEPLPDGHRLWSAPGVIVTPHIAGSVRQVHDRAWRFVAAQVERYVAGEPLLNVVVEGY
jgi:phosphoglycerate dehydrogenase-like enzyme